MDSDKRAHILRRCANLAMMYVEKNFFKGEFVISQKTPGEYVTDLETEIERIIKNVIRRHCPNDSIIGEESGEYFGKGDLTWYIDPIDGTNNLIKGRKDIAICIGVARGVKPISGIIVYPYEFLTVFGDVETKCISIEKKHKKAPVVSAQSFPIIVGLPSNGLWDVASLITNQGGEIVYRITGAAGFDLGQMPLGLLDARLGGNYKDCDVVAGVAVVRAAGGIVVNDERLDWTVGDRGLSAYRTETIAHELIERGFV